MSFVRLIVFLMAIFISFSSFVYAQSGKGTDMENTLYLDLESGRVVIEMRPDLAPSHVNRIKELVREGFYDGIVFHRVIE